ncbi:MAG: magnesium/cobalt transporter CorA [Luteibaculum sp.]
MARFIKTIKSKTGVAPGTLLYEGEEIPVHIGCYRHTGGNTIYSELQLEHVIPIIKGQDNFWINITGTPPISWYESLGLETGVHRLTLEDILSENQRPKMESYDDYVFYSLKMMYKSGQKKASALMEQLSMLQFKKGVLTFQHTEADTFGGIRHRLKNENTRIYPLNADYTVFCLLDTIVDHYMVITETVGNRIDKLEDQLFKKFNRDDFILKFSMQQRELNVLRKNIRPVKEIMVQTLKADNAWVKQENLPYFNDVYDHLLLVVETVDTYRDLLSDILNIHSTQMGNNMNQVMKTLTIFSAIFIPTTFIAGVYGTNFEYLPELSYKYSYFIFWGVLISMALSMVVYFKRKGWF